ncbi:MAG: phosphoribosyltransferase [Deltaproteobacteria bacterium]|nr:phosphoribosyltransferase [Deltaproteobacteria bacterium]
MADEDLFLDQRDSYEFTQVDLWFKEIIDEIEPDLVVAIARGAVRMLQLSNSLRHIPSESFISNNALPYLPDSALKEKRVLVVDDSVIFGSTMARTREYLFSRGARVFCASFCVDRMSFFGEDHENSGRVQPSKFSSIPLLSKFAFWPNQVRRHHDLLVRSLLCSPEHYNLDFPTYIFRTTPFSEEEVAYVCRSITSAKGLAGIEDVSTAVASSSGVHRFAAHTSVDLSWLLAGNGILFKPYGKVRLTVVPSQGQIRLTPIVQLAFPDADDLKITFTQDVLNITWAKFILPKSDDRYYKQAVFQLLTSVMSIVSGEALLRQVADNIKNELGDYTLALDLTDITFTVGLENASHLNDLHGMISNELKSQLVDIEPISEAECPIDEKLEQKTVEMWSKFQWLKPRSGETFHEMLGKVFICLRNLTDDRKSRLTHPDASRLDVGYSYESLFNLFTKHCEIEISKQQLSYALDTSVDNGLAVPKIINQAGYWQRVFYSGENEDSQDTRQLQLAFYEAYSDFLKGRRSRPLTPFDFHKLAVTLKDLFPWLPISTRYYTFGRYAKIGQSEEELIDWLTSNEFSPFKLVDLAEDASSLESDGNDLEYKKVLVQNPQYKPIVRGTLPIHKARDFYDAFEYVANAFSRLRQDHELLVSSCRTQEHAFNAIAFEAHSWTQGNHFNFAQVLQSFRLLPAGSVSVIPAVLDNIYWCTRYISEAYRKYRIYYYDYKILFNQIEKAFAAQGPAAQRFWKLYMFQGDYFSQRTSAELESRFNAIMDLIGLMEYLTAYAVKLLLDLKLIKVPELSERFANSLIRLNSKKYKWLLESDREDLAWKFNDGVRNWEHPGKSFMTSELPVIEISDSGEFPIAAPFQTFLDQYIRCFDQLHRWLSEFCPECEVPEGGFPYLPTSVRRLHNDGSMEKLLRDYCILTMDIIRSTNDEQTGAMKIATLEAIMRYKQHNLFFEKTHNDAFVVCSDNPQVLWDICFSVANVGEKIRIDRSRMAGSRKGLSRGSVIGTTDPNGVCMIRDAWTPHALPMAFSMLNGVDEYARKNGLDSNRLVIVNDKNRENFIHPLGLEPLGKEFVKGKHFIGSCHIVKLTE